MDDSQAAGAAGSDEGDLLDDLLQSRVPSRAVRERRSLPLPRRPSRPRAPSVPTTPATQPEPTIESLTQKIALLEKENALLARLLAQQPGEEPHHESLDAIASRQDNSARGLVTAQLIDGSASTLSNDLEQKIRKRIGRTSVIDPVVDKDEKLGGLYCVIDRATSSMFCTGFHRFKDAVFVARAREYVMTLLNEISRLRAQ